MSLDDALKTNAMALFSDKYKDKVRVVTIADSVELCGGCHVSNTKDINSFAIKSLESKGSNLYRVEAATDTNINKVLFESIKPYNDIMMSLLEKAKKIIESSASHGLDLKVDYEIFNINNDAPKCYQDIIFNMEEVDNIRNIVSSLEKNYHKLRVEQALKDVDKFDECLKEVNGYNTIIMKIENYDLDALKEVVDIYNKKDYNYSNYIKKTTCKKHKKNDTLLQILFTDSEIVKDYYTFIINKRRKKWQILMTIYYGEAISQLIKNSNLMKLIV